MSSNEIDDDLDAYAESIAKRTADRESRLQRLAMLKRQQLENDEEEFQKSKKQASSKTNVISTSNSPVKSPQKASSVFNYSSPSKNQFLPTFNSPQRSFVLTRSIEESSVKSPEKMNIHNDLLSVITPDQSINKTPVDSPEKLYNTPLKSASNSTIAICSPRPYQKSPHRQFMCHSPSQGLIASFASGTTNESTTPINSPVKSFNQLIRPYQSPISTISTERAPELTSSKVELTASKRNMSPVRLFAPVKSPQKTTPPKDRLSVSPGQSIGKTPVNSPEKQYTKSTSPITTKFASKSASSTVELNANKRNMSPVRLFASVKSSNPIKVVSPIKQSGLNTPEKLCVSDKKKLFENAIKEESENAKRVREQQDFLLRKKFPKNNFTPQNEPSMPKKIKTSIFEFENKFSTDSPKPSWMTKSAARIDIKPEPLERGSQVVEKTPVSTEPKILDVEMKQVIEDYSVREGDEISKFIDQVEVVELNKSTHFDHSLHSIAEEEIEVDQMMNKQTINDLEADQIMNKQTNDLEQEIQTVKLIKSSTKASLYPILSNFETRTSDIVDSTESKQIVHHNMNKSPPAKQSAVEKRTQPSKPITPMRTLSQYRREERQRKANSVAPSTRIDIEKARMKEEMERARWIIYQNDLKKKFDNLKALVDKYEKAIEQSSNAIALCLKNPDQRGSSSQLAAEQILLVSTQRRTACKDEMEKIETQMKSPLCRAPDLPLATGCISIERIQIPLKGDFIVGQVSDQDPLNHHFLCLIRCGERVLETELLDSANSIQEASIIFDLNQLNFNELDKDFEIQFELYGLALPKQKHHHNDKRSLLKHSIKLPPLSPKLGRSKKAANQMLTYSANQGFTRLGHCKFDWNNILDKKYELEDFMYNSPFNGQIEIDFKMNALYCSDNIMEDFLNVYDGKYWKSRYYVLKGYLLAYWNYKEDYADKNLPSLGSIDLRNCINRRIGPVSLNVCPRSFSFVLVIEEQVLDTKHKFNDNKVHKFTEHKSHTFAADSKEDFEKWTDHLNKLLPLIRIWESSAQPPQDLKFLEP